MPVATIEFLLTERPIQAEIEFECGSVLQDILPLIEQKLPCSLKSAAGGSGITAGTQADLFSSFIITRNGSIADLRTLLEDGDQIKVFHLVDGG